MKGLTMNRIIPAIFVLFATLPATLFAQSDQELTREAVQANKKLIVGTNMALSDEEKEVFWPIYEDYQKVLSGLNERTVALISDYAANYDNLTDSKARELLKEWLAIQKDELELQEDFSEKFANALPAQKVIRYYQIENKLRSIIDYELVDKIPLAKTPEE